MTACMFHINGHRCSKTAEITKWYVSFVGKLQCFHYYSDHAYTYHYTFNTPEEAYQHAVTQTLLE